MAKLAVNGGVPVARDLIVEKWPIIDDKDRSAVLEVVNSQDWCRLHENSKVGQFEGKYANFHGAKHCIATANGTVSLQLALRTLGIKAGDEAIVPAVSFIATASAVAEIGAIPIFADIDSETAQISPEAIEETITSRTKAVIIVHYSGYPANFDAILPIAKKHNLKVVEDAAHAHGTEWKRRKVGAIGDIGSFSFQGTKSLCAGEGGCVLTNDAGLAEKAQLIDNIGRVLGAPGYEHHILSSNYRMSEFCGAVLLSQLEKFPEQLDMREKNGEFLASELEKIGGVNPLKKDLRITKRGYCFFVIRYDRKGFKDIPRDKFIKALNAEGIPCHVAYRVPLYKQTAFKKINIRQLIPEILGEIPDYENLYLSASEKFCFEEQIAISHRILLHRANIQLILNAIVKIKNNIGELK
ncbi:MAG: DegT/DnrJ/EryC1/StrS family aminotransferase [bacterium]